MLNQMVSEGLCDEPQKQLMQALLGLSAAFTAGVAATRPVDRTEGADNHQQYAPNS